MNIKTTVFALILVMLFGLSINAADVIKYPIDGNAFYDIGSIVRINGSGLLELCDEGETPIGIITAYEFVAGTYYNYCISNSGIEYVIIAATSEWVYSGDNLVCTNNGKVKRIPDPPDGYVVGVALEDGTPGESIKMVINIVTGGGDAGGEYNQTITTGAGLANAEPPGSSEDLAIDLDLTTDGGLEFAGSGDARTIGVKFGTGLYDVARGYHTHTGEFDNYNHWKLYVNYTTHTDIPTGYIVNFNAGTNITLDHSSLGGVDNITINSTGGTGTGDGNNFPTSMYFNPGTGNLYLDRTGLATLDANLDGRYSEPGHTHGQLHDRAHSLHSSDDHNNVSVSGLITGDLLLWNGMVWFNYASTNFSTSAHDHSLTHPATGDVTGSGNVDGNWPLTIGDNKVTTNKILNSSVTNAKLANMGANTVKGNSLGWEATPTDIPIGSDQVLGRLSGGSIQGIDFGTASETVAWGNHTHAGVYDNYDSWTARPNDGGSAIEVTAGTELIFDGIGGATVTRGAGNTITIDASAASGANYFVNGVDFNTLNGYLTLTRLGLSDLSVNLDGRYSQDSHTHSLTFSGGDVIGSGIVGGTWALALNNTGVTSGEYGNTGANVPWITVDAKGRLTYATNRAITAADIGASSTSHTHSLEHTGDVTGSGDVSGTWNLTIGDNKVTTNKIVNSNVTNAKLANMAAYTIKSNPYGWSAQPSDISISNNKVLGRLDGDITPIDFGTSSGTVAWGDHTHDNMLSGTGTSDYNAYFDGTNSLAAEQYVAVSRGGLGSDMTASGVGNLIYSTSTSTYSTLSSEDEGNALISHGSGVAPSWGKIQLSGSLSHIEGILPVERGGTGRSSHTSNALITGGSSSTEPQQSLPNSSTSRTILQSSGSSSLPTWSSATYPSTIAANRILYSTTTNTIDGLVPSGANTFLKWTGSTYTWDVPAEGISGSGINSKVAFWTDPSSLSYNSNFHWDNINMRLGIVTNEPTANLHVKGTARLESLPSNTQNTILTVDSYGNVYKRASGDWTGGTNYWTLSGLNLYPNSTSYNIGVGTSSPSAKLDIVGDIEVNGDILQVDKIYCNQVDPISEIGGKRYSTWCWEGIGLRTDVVAVGQLSNGFYEINLAQEPESSDLWLFYHMVAESTIVPFVTPQAEAYLMAKMEGSKLIVKAISGDMEAKFSLRLSGKRIDMIAPPEELNTSEFDTKFYLDLDKYDRNGGLR
ncbi:hypothetical protein KAH81_09015 [bacterium]|nr:hypothetical protein [bacterium]